MSEPTRRMDETVEPEQQVTTEFDEGGQAQHVTIEPAGEKSGAGTSDADE